MSPKSIPLRSAIAFQSAIFIVAAVTISGQVPPASPTFEVASVKRNLAGGNGGGTRQLRGSFTATNSTLQALIRYAWGVMDYQIQGPGWMATERYDIDARGSVDADSRAAGVMLQNLLAERFGLKIRRDVRQWPVYALVVAKGGSRLPASKPAESTSVRSSNRSIIVNKVTVEQFATILSGQMDRPVLDSTGLAGTFDVSLEWTPDIPGAEGVPSGPSVFTALQEQLGLRLESLTGPVEVLIVDHAEKIPTGN